MAKRKFAKKFFIKDLFYPPTGLDIFTPPLRGWSINHKFFSSQSTFVKSSCGWNGLELFFNCAPLVLGKKKFWKISRPPPWFFFEKFFGRKKKIENFHDQSKNFFQKNENFQKNLQKMVDFSEQNFIITPLSGSDMPILDVFLVKISWSLRYKKNFSLLMSGWLYIINCPSIIGRFFDIYRPRFFQNPQFSKYLQKMCDFFQRTKNRRAYEIYAFSIFT